MQKKFEIIEEIKKLKKQKNAIILAHCYQNIEIDEVADFIGDSLFLSRQAAKTDADIIIFAGVYFMAETAKILSPYKKVLLPKLESGCPMADMINIQQLRNFKQNHPNCPVVCYVNSTAEIKAESDICCTSANAVQVVKSLPDETILFVPDKGLGGYVASQIPDKKIISFDGYCPIHMNISTKELLEKKKLYPDAKVLVHPECHSDVLKLADYIGSTTGIIKKAHEDDSTQFIIVTEKGVVDRLQRDLPEKDFILVSNKAICKDMKRTSLEDILNCLKNGTNEINVSEEVREKAFNTINKMITL